ncbi:Uncharacterized protein FWK35_00033574, partial [Aphis craccivora]
MTRSTRKLKSNKTGKEFVNSLINSLPVEAHTIDIKLIKFKSKDTPRKEKLVVYAVTNAMKAKKKK